MKMEDLDEAVELAKLFLMRARDAQARTSGISMYIEINKASGALRRTSMDLTRALAELRKT